MKTEVRCVHLKTPTYQATLSDYVRDRLKLDPDRKPPDAELLRAILDAADQRFAYVAFLTDRCERGKEDRSRRGDRRGRAER